MTSGMNGKRAKDSAQPWLGVVVIALMGVLAAWLDITGRVEEPTVFYLLGVASFFPLWVFTILNFSK